MLRRPVQLFLVLLALALCGMSTASAHSSVPIKMLCGDMTRPPNVVQSFTLSGEQLSKLVDTTVKALASDGLSLDDKCGIVDVQLNLELQMESDLLDASTFLKADEWTQATIALAMYCGQFSVNGVRPTAYVTDSSSGYNASTHHSTYKIANGVRGVCAICPPSDE